MSSGKLAKPVMRGLLHQQIKRNLAWAIGMTIAAGASVRIFLGNVRKETYKEYYKNLDIEKDFHEMARKGVFQSVQPNEMN